MKNSEVLKGRPSDIDIAFIKSGDRPSARYVSDTTVYEEALHHGRFIGLYWSASGQVQRENVSAHLPKVDTLAQPLHSFELEIDGQLLHNHWNWIDAFERQGSRPGTVEAVIKLEHQVRPVSVNVVTRMDGSSVLARWLEITNTGDAPAALSHVSPMSGILWDTDPSRNPSQVPAQDSSNYTLGYIPSINWGDEGDFVWKKIPSETIRIKRDMGRFHGSPYYILRNEITGELCFVSIAWSGNFFAEFSCREGKLLHFNMGPFGPAPLRVIAPGETVISPEVHIGLFHGSMDSAVSAWHRHVRASVLPPRPEGKEMYTVAGRVVEQPDEWILKEIDIAAEMGIEAFMVDAGWYGEEFASWTKQRGDWFEGSWLPGGMKGVRDHAKNKGLLFGLWMEPETMANDSRLHSEHPDWALVNDDGRHAGTIGLNLANPAAVKYMEDSIIGAMRDFELDFYKLDYNITVYEGGQNLRDGYAEHEMWRHFEVLHSIYDKVRKEFPDIALENCAGGGGRNDLGMLSRFHYACESDMSTHPLAIRAINAMTLFLPPEAICYYHNHISHAHQMADLDTHLRVSLFATPIFVGFGAQDADRTTQYFKKTKSYIELAKTFCRPVMANRPVAYHHTPDIGVLRPADWCVLEYASPDASRGYAGIFKLNGTGQNEYLFRPRGVKLAMSYEVTLHNSGQSFQITGRELTRDGILVRLDSALTSELVLYKAIE